MPLVILYAASHREKDCQECLILPLDSRAGSYDTTRYDIQRSPSLTAGFRDGGEESETAARRIG